MIQASPAFSASAGAPASAVTLLAGIVDYAGLFPPSGLDLPEAVAEYTAALAGDHGWMLGRFIMPGARLPELVRLRADAPRGVAAARTPEWHVSAIVGNGDEEIDRVLVSAGDPNGSSLQGSLSEPAGLSPQRWSDAGLRVDSLECKPPSLDSLERLADRVAGGPYTYVEVPPAEATTWMPRLASLGLRAKIRTGGMTADAFPPAAAVARFIAAALEHKVLFKATAGLHHAVRGSYRLTYATDAASAPMYGYLNLLLTTAALQAGYPLSRAEALLLRSETTDLAFTAEAVQWGDTEFSVAVLTSVRSAGLASFGSCSFREPVEELYALFASKP